MQEKGQNLIVKPYVSRGLLSKARGAIPYFSSLPQKSGRANLCFPPPGVRGGSHVNRQDAP